MQEAHSLEVEMPARLTDNALSVDESDNLTQVQEIVTELSGEAKLKMEVIQSLLEPCEPERASHASLRCSSASRKTRSPWGIAPPTGRGFPKPPPNWANQCGRCNGSLNSGRKKDWRDLLKPPALIEESTALIKTGNSSLSRPTKLLGI